MSIVVVEEVTAAALCGCSIRVYAPDRPKAMCYRHLRYTASSIWSAMVRSMMRCFSEPGDSRWRARALLKARTGGLSLDESVFK